MEAFYRPFLRLGALMLRRDRSVYRSGFGGDDRRAFGPTESARESATSIHLANRGYYRGRRGDRGGGKRPD